MNLSDTKLLFSQLSREFGQNGRLDHIKAQLTKNPGVADYVDDVTGRTLLHYACESPTPLEVVQLLVEKNPAAMERAEKYHSGRETGGTPLHLACGDHGSIAVVELLARKGPGPCTVKDACSRTPLYKLCEMGAPIDAIRCVANADPIALLITTHCNQLPLDELTRTSSRTAGEKVAFVTKTLKTTVCGLIQTLRERRKSLSLRLVKHFDEWVVKTNMDGDDTEKKVARLRIEEIHELLSTSCIQTMLNDEGIRTLVRGDPIDGNAAVPVVRRVPSSL